MEMTFIHRYYNFLQTKHSSHLTNAIPALRSDKIVEFIAIDRHSSIQNIRNVNSFDKEVVDSWKWQSWRLIEAIPTTGPLYH